VATVSVMRTAGVLPVSKRPELVIVYDLNDYPVSASCSSCGAAMPQRREWITSAAENLEWFANQFMLHLGTDDPDGGLAQQDPGRLIQAMAA
jgi:hypothetical protein